MSGHARTSVRQLFRQVAEVTTVLGALVYVSGFIVVNSYFLSYGYSVTPLFRVRYLSAGLLFLVVCTLVASSCLPIYWSFILSKKEAQSEGHEFSAVLFGGSAAAIYIFKKILEEIIVEDMKGSSLHMPLWVVFSLSLAIFFLFWFEIANVRKGWFPCMKKFQGVSILLYFIFLLLNSLKITVLEFALGELGVLAFIGVVWGNKQNLKQVFVRAPVNSAYFAAACVGSGFLLVSSFSLSVYPYVKPQFGGGLPSRVRIVLAEDKAAQVGKLGFSKSPVHLMSDALLLENSQDEFLVLVKSTENDRGVLLQLERRMVDTIMYLPPP